MIDKIDFGVIMDIIKLLSVDVGILLVIKQRSEVIIAKYKQNKAEEKANSLEVTIRKNNEAYEFIGETLLGIVQASKMTTEDKTEVTEQFLVLKNDLPKVAEEVKEVVKEEIPNLLEVVEDIRDISQGIIKRD